MSPAANAVRAEVIVAVEELRVAGDRVFERRRGLGIAARQRKRTASSHVRLGKVRRFFEGAATRVFGPCEIGVVRTEPLIQRGVDGGQTGERRAVMGIALDGLPEQLDASRQARSRHLNQMLPAAQVVLVGDGAGLRPHQPLPLLPVDRSAADAARDVLGDFVLHREHVGRRSVESLGPVLLSGRDVHQLHGDPQTFVSLPDAAVEQCGDLQVSRDLAYVAAGLPEMKRCRSRGHAQAGDLRQRGHQLFGDALAEVPLIVRRAHVDKGQDGDGGDGRRGQRDASATSCADAGVSDGHEPIASPVPGLDETRLFRIVIQRPPQFLHARRQGIVANGGAAPHGGEQVLLRDGRPRRASRALSTLPRPWA